MNITRLDTFRNYALVVHKDVTAASREFNYIISYLSFNTSYTVRIRAEGEYRLCPYNVIVGEYSDAVMISTADFGK